MHCGYIVKVKDIRKHSNADRLQVATFFGNDVIVGLDVKEGDKGVYFPTDLQLSKEFAEENNLIRSKGGYLEDNKRNIRTIKLRGEISDGLYINIDSLSSFVDTDNLNTGDKIDVVNGHKICKKYVPKSNHNNGTPKSSDNRSKKKALEEKYPYFAIHKDTEQLAYSLSEFKEGDLCYMTLKVHGTSGRTSKTLQKKNLKWWEKLINKPSEEWKVISGSRRVNLENFDGGFYGTNEFRKQYHDLFADKLEKGEQVYYEIVGFVEMDKPIMAKCNNKRVNDKAFVKRYGDTTTFTYGCDNGKSDVYVYRMTMTNEDGYEVEYPWEKVKIRCEEMGVKHVPELDKFFFKDKEDFMNRVNNHVSGDDLIDPSHIREGVVVLKERGRGFKAYKHKSTEFKILEGIIKDEGIADVEEEESNESVAQ